MYIRSPDSSKGEKSNEGSGEKTTGEKEVEAVVKEVAAKAKQVHIEKFTALCKDLQKKQEEEEDGGEVSEQEVSCDSGITCTSLTSEYQCYIHVPFFEKRKSCPRCISLPCLLVV